MTKQTGQTFLPVAADVLAVGLAMGLVPWLEQSLPERNTGAALIIAAAFILYAIAVHLLKKLRLQPDGHVWAMLQPWLSEDHRRVMGFFFSLFLSWVMVEQSGFFRTITQVELGDTGLSYYLLLGPLLWVVLAFMYMLVLSTPTDTTLEFSRGRDKVQLFLALLGVNLMMSVIVGHLAAAPYLNGLSPWLQSFLIIPLFVLLFAPPRLLYLFKSRAHPLTLLTFMLVIVVNAILVN